jgi:hypothetical protein
MGQTLVQLMLLVSEEILTFDTCEKFGKDFGIAWNGACFIFVGHPDWPKQSLYMRTENGGVAMCTGHLERIHHEANDECEHGCNLEHNCFTLMNLLFRRCEAATQFQARQAKCELKRLKRNQESARMTPSVSCTDPMCGWEKVYAARYGLPWFPCMHTVNSKPVDFDSLKAIPHVTLPGGNPPGTVDHGPMPKRLTHADGKTSRLLPCPRLEHLVYPNDGDTAEVVFLDQVCHEVRSVMLHPMSYSSVLVRLSFMYFMAKTDHAPVEDPEWQAVFRFEQLKAVINGNL